MSIKNGLLKVVPENHALWAGSFTLPILSNELAFFRIFVKLNTLTIMQRRGQWIL